MCSKRRADTELTRDNWDQEDEAEEEGIFQKASDDVLKNRVIKTARRRIVSGASDSEQKSIFSNFTGFVSNFENKKSFSFTTGFESTSKPPFSFSIEKPNTSVDSFTDSAKSTENKSLHSTSPVQFSFPNNKLEAGTVNVDKDNTLAKLSADLEKTANGKYSIEKSKASTIDLNNKNEDKFIQKLQSLNLLCVEWIIKHLNENLSYILTPIFNDYNKHLTQLREERQRTKSTICKKPKTSDTEPPKSNYELSNSQNSIKVPDFNASVSKLTFPEKSNSLFTAKNNEKKEGFNFDTISEGQVTNMKFFSSSKNDSVNSTGDKAEASVFQFGAQKEPKFQETKNDSKPTPFFSFKPNDSPTSFSIKVEETKEKNEEDCPPIIEDVAVKEDGSVYNKKCKVFIKKDGNFVDYGVGFLFLKLIGDEKKCQIIVRANNKLANIIMNVLLTNIIPVQKMNKNNVMIICCPNPEVKQPTPVLIKVKTEEDAEELFNTLKKYKK